MQLDQKAVGEGVRDLCNPESLYPSLQSNPHSLSDRTLAPLDPVLQQFASFYHHWTWQPIIANSSTGDRPRWTSEDWQISPRLLAYYWESDDLLIGLRPGNQTNQLVLDLDRSGSYCNPESIRAIGEALESIGLVRSLIVRSSVSGGCHLIFPLESVVNSFDLALLARTTLEQHGFPLSPGNLESFPNLKAYNSQYNAIRLPMQQGSCLLNADLNPIPADIEWFCTAWEMAANSQDTETLTESLAQVDRTQIKQQSLAKRSSDRASAWLADLEYQLAQGWTDSGQTNDLLKIMAQKHYVFDGFQGQDLIDRMVQTAITAPGYQQYCQHHANIQQRCRDWARSIEASDRYFPYGTQQVASRPAKPRQANNQEKKLSAIDRIAQAVKGAAHQVFKTTCEWLNHCKTTLGLSRTALYKHRQLWQGKITISGESCGMPVIEGDVAIDVAQTPASEITETPVVERYSARLPMKCSAGDFSQQNLNLRYGGVARGGEHHDLACGNQPSLSLPAQIDLERLPKPTRLLKLLQENAESFYPDPWLERVSKPT